MQREFPESRAPLSTATCLGSSWWLAAVVVVAVALRLAHVLALRATPWFDHLVVDPEYYDAWAQRIAAGDWLGDRAFYMDPLYPYVLGALYRVWGRDLFVARLLNVACGAAACVLVARLGRRVASPAVGAFAALGLAVYKPDVFYAGELDKTSLSVLLATATLLCAFGTTLRARFAAGVLLAATALTRANFLVFAPLVVLWYVVDTSDRRAGLTAAAVFVAGFALALAPVAWRNHHVSGAWVLTTTQLGQNLYTGNNPTNPYGAYGVVPFVRANPHFEEEDFRAEAEARAGRPLGPSDVSAFWVRATLAHVVHDPAFAARAFARKLVLFWNDFEISDSQDQYLLERVSPVLRLPLPGFGVVATLAALGAIAARGRRNVRLLIAFVGVYWISVAAFFLFSRYRIQVVPALLPVAALGLIDVVERVRAGDARRIAAATAVLGAAAWFSFQTVGLFARDHPRVVEMRLRHLANIYLTVGDAPRAVAALEEAAAGCPFGCPDALHDLFDVYMRTGRYAEGAAWFRRFARAHPEQRDVPEYATQLEAARDEHAAGVRPAGR